METSEHPTRGAGAAAETVAPAATSTATVVTGAGPGSGSGAGTLARAWLGLVKDFALAALLAVFVLVFLFQPFRVEGVSMLPQFADSDRIIVNKLSYRLGEIHRGDVVVFWFPEDPDKSFIKRVIGLPGDNVEIRRGTVYVNGEQITEPYVPVPYRLDEDRPLVTVRKGFYYVLGDHRSRSYDSRLWGLVPQRYIYGKVVLSYWPPAHAGFVAP